MRRYTLISLLLAVLILCSACAARPAGQAVETQADPELPELVQGDPTPSELVQGDPEPSEPAEGELAPSEPSTTELDRPAERIPMLPDAGEFAALLSDTETMKLDITMYDMNFTVRNPEGLGFVMENGTITDDQIGLKEESFGMGNPSDTIYRVPFAEGYRFAYAYPHDHCAYLTIWGNGEVFCRVQGSGIETVDCSLGGVRLTGEDMDYTIKFNVHNEDGTLLKVTGSGEDAVCLVRTADGFRFYCENGAHMELPDFYEISAVRELEIPAGTVGVLEGISKGYSAELSTEPFPD